MQGGTNLQKTRKSADHRGRCRWSSCPGKLSAKLRLLPSIPKGRHMAGVDMGFRSEEPPSRARICATCVKWDINIDSCTQESIRTHRGRAPNSIRPTAPRIIAALSAYCPHGVERGGSLLEPVPGFGGLTVARPRLGVFPFRTERQGFKRGIFLRVLTRNILFECKGRAGTRQEESKVSRA